MSGPENLRGVDYQISISLHRVLQELCLNDGELASVQFESLSNFEEDLNFRYKDQTEEYIQIKKRMEGYLWTSSAIRPVLARFLVKNDPRRRLTFITDAPGSIEVRELRNCLDNDRVSDDVLSKFCGEGVSLIDLRGIAGRLRLRTREFVSSDDSDPAREVKREIGQILSKPPFVLTQPVAITVDLLWTTIFNHAERSVTLTLEDLIEDLTQAGVKRSWKRGNLPPIVEDFRGRNAETKALADIIDKYPWTVIYGISGIGKTSLVSDIVRSVRFADRDAVWINITPLTTIPIVLVDGR